MTYKHFGIGVLCLTFVLGAASLRSSFIHPEQVTSVATAAAANSSATTSAVDAPQNKPAPVTAVGLQVNATISVEGKVYPLVLGNGTTALDAMRSLQESGDLTFDGQDTQSLGFFVESINGKKNADGMYWFLYVNGKSSDTGVSSTRLNPGDAVEWKYEKNNTY